MDIWPTKGLGHFKFPYKPGPQHSPKGIKRTIRIIRSGGCCNQLLLLLLLLLAKETEGARERERERDEDDDASIIGASTTVAFVAAHANVAAPVYPLEFHNFARSEISLTPPAQ